jgi:sugar lactone lactonase YvrE
MTNGILRIAFPLALVGVFGAGFVSAATQAPGTPENNKLETVVTLPSSGSTENLCQAADGSIYITGLDDKVLYKVTNARLEKFATFPNHSAIVGVAAGNNEVVLTVFTKPYRRPAAAGGAAPGGPDFSDVGPEVLILDKAGKVKATVSGQKGQAFNGITPAGKGIYFIADTGSSMLWRFDSGKKQLEPWLKDVPGANGIKVHNGWVYVSTRAGIQRVQMDSNGRPGVLTMFAQGVRADDFDIAKDGTIYIPIDTTMNKLSPNGEVSKFLDNVPNGAAALVSKDGKWLYWSTRRGDAPQRLVRVAIQ